VNQSSTDWYSVVLWRGLADLAKNYLHQSSLVYAEGKLKNRSFDDQEGNKKFVTEIFAKFMTYIHQREV
jgi:single-strand DNA-binding protein